MNAIPYHQLARANGRGRAIGELLLAPLLWGVLGTVVFIALSAAGVSVEGADGALGLAILTLSLGLLVPVAMLSARIVDRKPGYLSSVAGRLRWRLLGKLTLLAVGLRLLQLVIDTVVIIATDGWASLAAESTWPGFSTFAPLALLVLVVIPIQIAGEEYLFRGTFMQVVGAFTRNVWVGIVLTSAVFAVAHRAPVEATVALFVFGAVASWLTVRTGGLEAALAIHGANNATLFVLVAATGGADTWLADLNQEIDWLTASTDIVALLVYAWLAARLVSAQRALATADQVEQHAPERRLGVEHADDRAHAEPLTP